MNILLGFFSHPSCTKSLFSSPKQMQPSAEPSLKLTLEYYARQWSWLLLHASSLLLIMFIIAVPRCQPRMETQHTWLFTSTLKCTAPTLWSLWSKQTRQKQGGKELWYIIAKPARAIYWFATIKEANVMVAPQLISYYREMGVRQAGEGNIRQRKMWRREVWEADEEWGWRKETVRKGG